MFWQKGRSLYLAGGDKGIMGDIVKELKRDGLLLKNIPKKDQTIELCKVAIRQNPIALKFASRKCVDNKICLNAVKKDAEMFRFVPDQLITEKMCKLAVSINADLLNNVPEYFRTIEICLLAIENNPNTLSYVSNFRRYELFTEKTSLALIEKVVRCNKSWLTYMPACKKVIELCLRYIGQDFTISQFIPESLKNNREILDFQKSIGKIKFVNKFYEEDSRNFFVNVKVVYGIKPSISDESKVIEESYIVTIGFKNFNTFYEFLDGNLNDAELRPYGFEQIDLTQYNIKGAVIHSDILNEQGLYNGEFYANFKNHIENSENQEIVKNEINIQTDFSYPQPVDDEEYDRFDFKHIPFFYVSDIHLCHRIINQFKEKATREEIYSYVKSLAIKMVASIGLKPNDSYLLIAGDTSSDFEIAKVFYGQLVQLWNPKRIVIILGNHELWDPYIELDDSIQVYRAYFNNLGISFLHNDLLFINEWAAYRIINEQQMLELGEEAIRKLVQYSSVIILGGIGFSGLNDKYNAINMRYGKTFEWETPKNALHRDIQESNRFDLIYRKLLSAIPKNKVIVLTHMKKGDWNADTHNPNWIYLNGHNHRNYLEVGNKRAIYADNQIGYKSQNIGLKYFYIDNEYDIFAYYQDGIYTITKDKYDDFSKGKMIQMSFSRDEGTIYMIKKNDIYMFFIYCLYSNRSKNKYLYLMNGGKICKLIRNSLDDLNFYYDNLEKYTENVRQLLDKYTGGQHKISDFIKRLGGSGKIHGCIVDVEKPDGLEDFSYYHLFINPTDGKVTPYFAYDVKSRVVYKDFKAMLESNEICKLLKDNYLRLEKEAKYNLPDIQYSGQLEEWGDEVALYDEDSYLYKISRIIKSLQYVTEKNVIRIWNVELLNYDFISRIRRANTIEGMVDDALVVEI